jgi:hypothetical protein
MHYARARSRYLAALGLTGLSTAALTAGCQHAEPAGAPAATQQAAPAARHKDPWIPAVEAAPTDARPGPVRCPHGPFCVPQASASCPTTVPLPSGIGPGETPNGRAPSVTFDAERTTAERASDPSACCYQWNVLCVGGRALRGPEGPLTAPATARRDWLDPAARVDVAAIAPATRAALAAHWEREAAFEHASVASFSRASLTLLAAGAPADLIAETHAAALDEIDHARIGYALASAYAGAARGPSPLPLAPAPADTSLATLAVETFVDACAGESAAALALREAAAAAHDPAVIALLSRIAEDEERHAELAWRTVAWALSTGGPAVARALADAINALRVDLAQPGPEPEPDLTAHGVLGRAAQHAIRRRALAEVVLPCAAALLAPTAALRC